MVPYDRFTVVLDACTLFPMLARDVLLTLAAHEFFSPKWSARIRDEWTRNLLAQMQRSVDGDAQKRVDRIVAAMTAAFPDADVDVEPPVLPHVILLPSASSAMLPDPSNIPISFRFGFGCKPQRGRGVCRRKAAEVPCRWGAR